MDVVPTFTTSNARMCLLLSNGRFGLLRIEDAERLQVSLIPSSLFLFPIDDSSTSAMSATVPVLLSSSWFHTISPAAQAAFCRSSSVGYPGPPEQFEAVLDT